MSKRRYPLDCEPSFCYAVEHTLAEEGFFSDFSWDKGGKTKFGITEAVARKHGYDIHTLTVEQAIEIYYLDYWRKPGLQLLSSWHIATECFDTQVNTGNGAIVAQRALVYNLFATESEIGGIDGKWGPKTRGTINRVSIKYERNLLGALNGELYKHYHAIKPHRPDTFENAIRGWMNRVWPSLDVIDKQVWINAATTGVKP